MGLSTTHGAFNSSYSTFNDFRRAVLKAYNGQDLFQYKGFEGIKRSGETIEYKGLDLMDTVDDDGLVLFLSHSDCEDDIRWVDCGLVAASLSKLSSKIGDYWLRYLIDFIEGCNLAFEKKENLLFQ